MRSGPVALVAALFAGVAVGLFAGRALWQDGAATRAPAEAGPPEAGAPRAEVTALREALAREARLRQRLEAELAEVREAAEGAAAPADPAVAARTQALEPGEDAADAEADGDEGDGSDPWLDASVLARGGFRPADVERLREFYEGIELERLYLHDQATREGWIGEPRFRRRSRELDIRAAQLRDEWDDDAWDWILYARGRPNRVVVEAVMDDSQAAALGVEEGDVILRYEDARVFGVPGLRQATTGGELGETVTLEIERDGSRLRLFPERGPLGVALRMESREPDAPAY